MAAKNTLCLAALALPLLACTQEPPPPPPMWHCVPTMMAFFDSGSATIMEQSRRSLRNMFVADGLGICSPNSRPLFLCVTGHTDKSGDETANRRLSLLRAQAVADYLVELGVAREHIAVRGRGSSEMLVQQSPPYGSEPQNRRVQIVWDKKAAFATCK